MESKEYFEKVMLDHNQNRKGRSLRKETPGTIARCFHTSYHNFWIR